LELLDPELFKKVQSSKVLVVGAGGIGCELLKNLVLHGFENIVTVDLDTIDLSNLNRQFLFRREHIGKSKAEIAAKVVMKFNRKAKVEAIHGNIKADTFGVDFFKQFTLVMNALDNVGARRHVNRLCLAAKVPLIESGTAGYLGQTSVIFGGETECYECQPKPTPKTFAVCTIRSTPSQPVHCIVWAKELYGDLFAPTENTNDIPVTGVDEYSADAAALQDEQIKSDSETLQNEEKQFGKWRHLFHKTFYTDVFRRMRVAELANKTPWKGKTLPRPLSFNDAIASDDKPNDTETNDNSAEKETSNLKAQKVMSLAYYAQQFLDIAEKLSAREKTPFDKDDDLALKFVVAASNLRAHVFSIPLQSEYSTKSIAGNIVPAIATTNAVIAGLIVLEALKVVDGRKTDVRCTYLLQPNNKRKLMCMKPDKPNPACYVCQQATLTLSIDVNKTTIATLVSRVLCDSVGFNQPQIMRGDSLLYESGDGLDSEEIAQYEKLSAKTLAEMGVKHQTMLSVDDFSQRLTIQLVIQHQEEETFTKKENDTALFRLTGVVPNATQNENENATTNNTDDQDDDDDDLIIVEPNVNNNNKNDSNERKRKLEDNTAGGDAKRAQLNGVEVIDLD